MLDNLTREQWNNILRNEFINDIMYQKDMDSMYHHVLIYWRDKMKLVVGLGNKARQGKDFIAEFIQKTFDNVHIIHWADALYEEVRNAKRITPLIKYIPVLKVYEILDGLHYKEYYFEDVPLLHKIFELRNITCYMGMDDKDSLMLQFWGTDFRRKYFGQDYWIKKGLEKINSIENGIILVPDTRFKNEALAIKTLGGYFLKVVRLNEDGSRYIAKDRDPSHISEIDLDDYKEDFLITCESGNLESLKSEALNIFESLTESKQNQCISKVL